MVHVVVMVKVKEGKVGDFVRLFKSVASTVAEEKGCVQYMAMVDAPMPLRRRLTRTWSPFWRNGIVSETSRTTWRPLI